MPETLVIRLPEDAEVDAQWTVIDESGTRIGEVRRGPLRSAADEQLQRKVLVLVPGTQTVTARTNLPVRSASKMLQVVPFALEPQLAGEVTEMHFAVGGRNDEGEVAVIAVAKETMAAWTGALAEAGISARRVLPDTAGVPVTEGGMTVVVLEDEAYLRDRDGDVFAVDHESVVATLELLVQPGEDDHEEEIVSAEEPGAPDAAAQFPITVYLDDSSGVSGESLLTNIHTAFSHCEFRRLPYGLLPRIAAEARDSNAPNLLQGEYASGRNLRRYWLPWRTAAGLAAALLLVGLTVKGAELFTYKSRYAQLGESIHQVYAETFPGESIPTNPRLAFERRMTPDELLGTGSEFLDGLEILSRSRPESSDLVLKTMNFNAGVLNLELLAADVPTIDALRERVSQASPWQAKLTQTSPEDDRVLGRLQIQRASP